MGGSPTEIHELELVASEVAAMLRALGNERRLMTVCKLAEWGEANVTTFAEALGLSQSALSQHLTRLRERGIVTWFSGGAGAARWQERQGAGLR